jgi:hypothetical protein
MCARTRPSVRPLPSLTTATRLRKFCTTYSVLPARRIPSPDPTSPPSSSDQAGDAGLGIDREEVTREAVHDHERPPAARGLDPVRVELAGDKLEVAAQRKRLDVHLGAELPAGDGNPEEHRVERIREPGRAAGDDDIVDEARPGRQLIDGELGARPGVVDVRLAGRAPGDEEPVAMVDLEPHRYPALLRADDGLAAISGPEISPDHGAGCQRTDVEVPASDRDALGLKAVRQSDRLRKRRSAAAGAGATAKARSKRAATVSKRIGTSPSVAAIESRGPLPDPHYAAGTGTVSRPSGVHRRRPSFDRRLPLHCR